MVSKGSRTSPEPSFDPLIFPEKSAKISPGIRPKFYIFFFGRFRAGSPSLGALKSMKEKKYKFFFALIHFPRLGKCIKAISKVEAIGVSENSAPKEGGLIRPNIE